MAFAISVSVSDQITADLDRLFPQQINLSIDETAKAIGRHPASLRNMSTLGKLPFQTIKIGSRRLVPKSALAAYLASLQAPPPKPKRGAPTKAQRIAKAAAVRDPRTVDFVNGKSDAEGRV